MSQRANLIDQLNALEIFRAVFRRNEEWSLYADHCRMLAGLAEELAKLEGPKALPVIEPLPPVMGKEELKRRLG